MKHIVIIDDSPTIRMSVEYALKKLGYPFKHAENGVKALDVIKEIKTSGDEVAICICDVNMPEMDGISFVKEFRKGDKFSPIIMLTTESESEKIKEGKVAGASGWMIKPFKPDDLIAVVEKLMR